MSLVLVIILFWGCCNVGTDVEMVPNLKSKNFLTTLRSKNHLLRGWVSRACLQVSRPEFAWKEDSHSLSWRETSMPSTVWSPHRTSVVTKDWKRTLSLSWRETSPHSRVWRPHRTSVAKMWQLWLSYMWFSQSLLNMEDDTSWGGEGPGRQNC